LRSEVDSLVKGGIEAMPGNKAVKDLQFRF